MNDEFNLNSELLIKRIDQPINIKKDLSTISNSGYTNSIFRVNSQNYSSITRNVLNPILDLAEEKGYLPNIATALYEVVKNSFEHGNSRNPNKDISVGYKFNESNLEFLICDQGEILPKSFLRFILSQREQTAEDTFLKWYEFSNEKKFEGGDNLGTGISFMHAYMDSIKYFHNEEMGGLAVYMRKELN